MADTLMVAVMIGFIALCIAYTKWCDSIIGKEEPQSAAPAESEQVA